MKSLTTKSSKKVLLLSLVLTSLTLSSSRAMMQEEALVGEENTESEKAVAALADKTNHPEGALFDTISHTSSALSTASMADILKTIHENANLKAKVASLKGTVESLEKKRRKDKKTNNELAERVIQLKDQLKKGKASSSQETEDLDQLTQQVQHLQEENDSLSGEVSQLAGQAARVEELSSQLEKTRAALLKQKRKATQFKELGKELMQAAHPYIQTDREDPFPVTPKNVRTAIAVLTDQIQVAALQAKQDYSASLSKIAKEKEHAFSLAEKLISNVATREEKEQETTSASSFSSEELQKYVDILKQNNGMFSGKVRAIATAEIEAQSKKIKIELDRLTRELTDLKKAKNLTKTAEVQETLKKNPFILDSLSDLISELKKIKGTSKEEQEKLAQLTAQVKAYHVGLDPAEDDDNEEK